jgi:hypothetical protein
LRSRHGRPTDTPADRIERYAIKFLPLILLLPFAAVFTQAARIEYRRWVRHGPAGNARSNFPIDESAPGYEAPPEAEPDDTPPQMDHAGGDPRAQNGETP